MEKPVFYTTAGLVVVYSPEEKAYEVLPHVGKTILFRSKYIEDCIRYAVVGIKETDTLLYRDFEILIDGKAVYCSITSFRVNYRSIDRARKAIDNYIKVREEE